MIAVVAVSFASQLIVSDPNFVPLWFVVLSPVSYIVGLLVSTPVSVAVGALTWLVSTNRGTRRSVAIGATFAVWTPVIAIAAFARTYDSRTVAESAITLGVSLSLFAVLMPLPRPLSKASLGA